MASLTIVHIEDEYSDFLSLTTTLKTLIEDHWFDILGENVIARRSVLAESPDQPPSWIAYEMVVEQRPDQKFRWIFVRDAILSTEIKTQMQGRVAFILDVLRPDENGTTMRVSLRESLQSIREIASHREDVVLYTAYQGTGIDALPVDLLEAVGKRIRKEDDVELDDFLSNLVYECISDG